MLFDRHFDRPGPGVAENEPRKAGFARYVELLARDFPSYWKAGMLAFLSMLPYCIGVVAAMFASSVPLVLAAGLVGGLIAAPCHAGLYDTLARSLRDEPGYWWHTYQRAVAANARASLLPGALQGLYSAAMLLYVYSLLFSSSVSAVHWGIAVLCLLLGLGAFPYCWLQLVLVQLTPGQLAKNTLLLWFASLPRTLLSAALQAVFWGFVLALLPYSVLLMPLVNLWLPASAAALAIYKPVEKAFAVEENVRKLHEQQRESEG